MTAAGDMAAQSGSQQQGRGSVELQKSVLCLLSLWTSLPECLEGSLRSDSAVDVMVSAEVTNGHTVEGS